MRKSILSKMVLFPVIICPIISFCFSCSALTDRFSDEDKTQFAINRENDIGLPYDSTAMEEALGTERYDQLVSDIGDDALARLAYGAGETNMITFINLVDDVNKIIAMLTGVNALTPEMVVDLLNQTDAAVVFYSPPSDDTIGKIAASVNGVDDVQYLKDIMHGLEDHNGKTGMERMGIMMAMLDEFSGTLPYILNNVCNTVDGTGKMIRLTNGVDDMTDMTTMINETTTLENIVGIINNLVGDDPPNDGVGNLVSTLNVADPSRMAYITNSLDVSGEVNNDDDFETGTMDNLNWAVSGDASWDVTSTDKYAGTYSACIGLAGVNDMDDGDVASLEITTSMAVAGTMSYARRVSSESGSDYLRFYVDDVLVDAWSGNETWALAYSGSLDVGIHRFRWEFVKDNSGSGGSDSACIDNIVVPGFRGAPLFAYEKMAILFNMLSPAAASANTIGNLINSVDANGLENMIYTTNMTAYPVDYLVTPPRYLTIINNLTAVDTMAGLLSGLTPAAARQQVDLMDYVADVMKVVTQINGLSGAPGEKMYQLINGFTPAGTSSLIKMMDATLDANNLLTLLNDVTDTSYMPIIYNNLTLAGTDVSTIGADSSPTSAGRMGIVVNKCDENVVQSPVNDLTIAHMVRLVNEISIGSGAGAENVGRLMSGLDNTVSPPGAERMIALMNEVSFSDIGNTYNDPLCGVGAPTCTSDKFGRLITNINDMGGNGISTIGRLINEMDYDKIPKLAYLVKEVRKIRYLTYVTTNLTNPDILIAMINDADLDEDRLRLIMDVMGDGSYDDGEPAVRYVDGLTTGLHDPLGRMTTLMNEVVSANGPGNMIASMNNFSNFSDLTGLIGGLNEDGSDHPDGGIDRIRYLSDIMNNVENIDLMINLFNGFPAQSVDPAEYGKTARHMNEIGGSTQKGTGTKPVGDMSILWGTMNTLGWNYGTGQPRPPEEQSRMIALINDVEYCGIDGAYDLNDPENHLVPEPCTPSGLRRLSEYMLGMNDTTTISYVVGDVTDVTKTVKHLNGIRNIQTMIDYVNYLPGEVTAAYMNKLESDVVFTTSLYMMNRFSAKALAALTHYGTGLGGYTDGDAEPAKLNRNTGPCHEFTGFGPRRLATLMNVETGERLKALMDKMGWRTSVASLLCGFGTPNIDEPQMMADKNHGGEQPFYRRETIRITDDKTPGNRGTYWHVYEASSIEACTHYLPEKIDGGPVGNCIDRNAEMDRYVWNDETQTLFAFLNCTAAGGMTTPGGISGIWDIMMEEGATYAILSLVGASLPSPTLQSGEQMDSWSHCSIDSASDAPVQVTASVDDTVSPVITFNRTSPDTTTSMIVNFDLNGTDNNLIVGWIVNETSTVPTPNDPGWRAGKPTSYTVSTGPGLKTLYARAIDRNSNISNTASITVTIELDEANPVITEFALTSGTPSIAGITFQLNATDNSGLIAGWMINETPTKPSAGDVNWQASKPGLYTLQPGYGTKSVYAWAKDYSGNVSDSASITVNYLNDDGPPVITNFALTSNNPTSNSDITFSLAASDATPGNFYWMIKEDDSVKPLAGDTGWVTVKPATHTMTGYGTKNIYVWGRDDVGFISDSRSVIVQYIEPGTEDLFKWNKNFSGSGAYSDRALGVAVDPDGNVYVAGFGTNLVAADSEGDFWIKKFSGEAESLNFGGAVLAYCRSTGDPNPCTTDGSDVVFDGNGGEDRAQAIAIHDDAGTLSIYAAGFGTGLTGSNGQDWWIKKFDKDGIEDITWDKKINFSGADDIVRSIKVDAAGNLYAAGYGTSVSNGRDSWIKRFSSDGTEDWDHSFDINGDDNEINQVALDGVGNIYAAGYGTEIIGTLFGTSDKDWIIKKYNSTSGVEQDFHGGASACTNSVKPCTTNGLDIAFDGNYSDDEETSIIVSPDGYIYIAGYGENIDGAGSGYDWSIMRLSPAGVEDTGWRKKFDGNGADDVVHAMALDIDNSLYVTGYGSNIVESGSGADWSTKKFYYDGGNFVEDLEFWIPASKKFSSAGEHDDMPYAIVTTPEGYIYVVGYAYFDGTGEDWLVKKFVDLRMFE